MIFKYIVGTDGGHESEVGSINPKRRKAPKDGLIKRKRGRKRRNDVDGTWQVAVEKGMWEQP